MSIPLVQEATKDAINTSIIAIKRNIERINMLLGLSNSEEIDTSKFATKDELQQAVTDLQPVNEVAVDNMQSVSSNAVAESLSVGAFEDLSMPQNVEVTIQKDGVLFISAPQNFVANTGRILSITLNGFYFEYYFNANLMNNWGATAIIPVFAGDKITVNSTQTVTAKIRYYNR